jgi:catechol 2,3-dioxygenase-like lactoylglutathione lyase family enzyme
MASPFDVEPCIPPQARAGKHRIGIMEKAVPILPADDLSAAKQFYVDKLGFRFTFEEGDGKSGFMGVVRGTISITIDAPMSGHGRHACVVVRHRRGLLLP